MFNNESTSIESLLDIMARLRDPRGGCPWDLKQSFNSIAPYTIEEAYEVADAIVHGDMDALCDELGDLLFQVVFHARMAEEGGHFDFSAVVGAIVAKMIRRHPHVFADATAKDEQQVRLSWEAIKAKERAQAGKSRDSAMDGINAGMPALTRATKLQQRAAQQSFDWPDAASVMDKVREETQEIEAVICERAGPARAQEEIGDLLFTAVNLARHLSVDPEMALAGANARFEARFRHLEQSAEADSDERSLAQREPAELEALWQAAKRALDSDAPSAALRPRAPRSGED